MKEGRRYIRCRFLRIIVSLPDIFSSEKLKMKELLCCAVLLLVYALVQVQGCVHNDETLPVGTHYRDCLEITCNKDGTMFAVTCPESICQEGKQIGYHPLDITKPYPECCARPICKHD